MKVVILGKDQVDGFEAHVKMTLEEMGHSVHIVECRLVNGKYGNALVELIQRSSKVAKSLHYRSILKSVLKLRPDLVIVAIRWADPEFVKGIKNAGIRIISINVDAVTNLANGDLFVEPYDAYFTKDPYILRFMRDKLEFNAHLLHEAFNPSFHFPSNKSKIEAENEVGIDVAVMGTLYPYRTRMVELLLEAGLRVRIFGNRPVSCRSAEIDKCYTGEYITGPRKSKLLYGSKIVFNNMHYAEVESVNCKFFELLGIGCVQVCDDKPVLRDLANPPCDVVPFNDISSAVEVIRDLLSDPDRRSSISREAIKLSLDRHTYRHRMDEVFRVLNLS